MSTRGSKKTISHTVRTTAKAKVKAGTTAAKVTAKTAAKPAKAKAAPAVHAAAPVASPRVQAPQGGPLHRRPEGDPIPRTITPAPRAVSAAIHNTAQSAIAAVAPTATGPLTANPNAHLLSRFAFGPDTASLAYLTQHGPDAWWDSQVQAGLNSPIYQGNPLVASRGTSLSMSPAQVQTWLRNNGNAFGWDMMFQLTEVTLGLQCWSKAQLYETVVDFFGNHLNVANHSQDQWLIRHTMDRDVVRKYAFGSYSDMLVASSKNPAMLRYLSLAVSTKSAINENYGRELLELHTVGIGNYTETDVQNSARVLTGRTMDASLNYVYNPSVHWVGPITVMGFSDPNGSAAGGEAVGDAYLRYLARHPQTAQRLARKLCIRYVSDTPSDALISAVAQAYLDNDTQILPMLHAIFCSEEFWTSRGAKIRRPLENMIATIRTLGLYPVDLGRTCNSLRYCAGLTGQLPLTWPSPDGFPDVAARWRSSSTLLNLWSLHRLFVQNNGLGFGTFNLTGLYGTAKPATSGEAIDVLTMRLTQTIFPPEAKAYLQNFLKEAASRPFAQSSLRWNLPHLVPLILDGPQHAYR